MNQHPFNTLHEMSIVPLQLYFFTHTLSTTPSTLFFRFCLSYTPSTLALESCKNTPLGVEKVTSLVHLFWESNPWACKAFSSDYNVVFMLLLSFQILLSNSWWCIYCTKFPECFWWSKRKFEKFESISVLGIFWGLQICFHITCIFFTSKVMSDAVTMI